jgi:hypothetical protein
VRVTIPLEVGRLLGRRNPIRSKPQETYLKERLFERVVRDIDVQASTYTPAKKQVRDSSGNLYDMIFVNNTNNTGIEDGSYAHPYNTLAEAFTSARYIGVGGSAKYIYVSKGDGTATGYTGNYTLANNVILWGSGYDAGFRGLPSSGYPVIDGGAGVGNIITLANNNTVMGCQLQNSNGYGIYGLNKTGALLQHNYLQTFPVKSPIYLTYNAAGNYSGTVSYNTILGSAGVDSLYIYGANANVATSFAISNNTLSNGNSGIFLRYDSSSAGTFIISNNTIVNVTNSGIFLFLRAWAAPLTMTTTVDHNIITSAGMAGIFFNLQNNQALGIGNVSAALSYNRISDSFVGFWVNGGGGGSVGPNIMAFDAGGGALNSPGMNSIVNNAVNMFGQFSFISKVQNNWWGQSPPDDAKFDGTADYSNWLTSDPN